MNGCRRILILMLVLILSLSLPVAAYASGAPLDDDYRLIEDVILEEEETPLAAGPVEQSCCVLHFVLMLCALAVAVYYTYDSKKRQAYEFQVRAALTPDGQ